MCMCVYGGLSASHWSQTMGQSGRVSVMPSVGMSEGDDVHQWGITNEYQAGQTGEEVM